MHRRVYLAVAVSALACMALAGPHRAQPDTSTTPAERDLTRTITVDGRARRYHVHLPPAYDGRRALPLVVVLHGGGGSAERMDALTGFSAKADSEGFLVVYPEGTGPVRGDRILTWNSGNCCGYALDHGVDDIAFIRAMLDRIAREQHVDSLRVYATGISNGGMMAYRLACELAARFAAVAPVAGALNIDCAPSEPVSVMAIHGTADQHVLFAGGQGTQQADRRHPRIDQPVSHAMSVWASTDGCVPAPARAMQALLRIERYTGCRSGTEVELVAIEGEGHTWPGGTRWAFWAPEPTQAVHATAMIWDFFSAHPKQTGH